LSPVLPIGFLSIRDAAEVVAESMFVGVPDRPVVTKLRAMKLDVADGKAIDDAIAAIWKAVDTGKVRALAIGGRPRRIVQLAADLTGAIPGLRSPRGRDFNLLRPRNPYYGQITDWFGLNLASVTVAFRETEVIKLASSLRRTRRNAQAAPTPRGRPSRQAEVISAIEDIVARQKWSSHGSLKDLTRSVNRIGTFHARVSEDTVGRALDRLYSDSRDRRYQRISRKRRIPK
jgi:hypothetical protein